jgi:hypothetical protein
MMLPAAQRRSRVAPVWTASAGAGPQLFHRPARQEAIPYGIDDLAADAG